MVKVRFYKSNIFTSQDIPAYLELDTEGTTVRLKVYEGAITYIDDTATGTNRVGYQVIQIWATNPNTLPTSPIGRAIVVEIYDTANNLLEKRRLPYLYGTPYRQIQIRDENNNPMGANIALLVYPFYYSIYFSQYIIIPFNPASEPRQFIEVYKIDTKKYYLASRADTIATLTSISLTPIQKATVIIEYKVDNPHLKALFGARWYSHIAGFIDSFFNFIVNNFIWLANEISRRIGIPLPIVRVELNTASLTLKVYYEQDIAPIIEFIIILVALAIFISLPDIIDMINNIVTSSVTYKTIETTETLSRQRTEIANKMLEYCAGDTECVRQAVTLLNTPDPNLASALSEIQSLRKKSSDNLLLGATIGAIGGGLVGYAVGRGGRVRKE